MGSHTWEGNCPCCGFEHMLVASYGGDYFDMNCPVCGYAKWTEERKPNSEDVELAKRTISKMSDEETEKVIELYDEDNTPLIVRLKDKP